MALGRIVPVLMLASGATYATQTGGQAIAGVVDGVKSVVTRFELAQVQQIMQIEVALGGAGKWARDPAAFGAYLRENLQSRQGRNSANDLWDVPFELRAGSDGIHLVASNGPNKQPDVCTDGPSAEAVMNRAERVVHRANAEGAVTAPADPNDWWKSVPAQSGAAPIAALADSGAAGEPDEPAPSGPDDVCIAIDLRGSNQSAYRPIPQ
ncbi:MAG: hypothetical protein EXR79_15495 [Myxococcales bacterium]|nr:hypothetical protein [Myxococcales bacterium]